MKIKSAKGLKGCLIYIHGANKYMFRVYRKDKSFEDYELLHNDLSITITDADSALYDYGKKKILDHSPETLGIEKNERRK